ncbi:recombinase family protein [Rufibacter glacialis]|uniref:Recombinase family protein n=1 Tax=Rufibacter glacialis TaxID=1259555 RepID=A0A5M8Q9Y9_9BACT|nr:recombinase family protein [Rufibacter glacialis]KAA6431891.1 recombinase family protein [Rufibacter glacialis]GGK80663.1 resolvase [Rufibacter glacialis]
MQIGYARVSTIQQVADLQHDALRNAGCEKIYTDKVSGSVSSRPSLNKVREILRRGDTLVVWRLDRLGRSLKDLIEWMTYLDQEGIALRSLQENIDTSTATGKLVYHVFGAISEFEKGLLKERVMAGLTAARARGRVGGRPQKLSDQKKKLAVRLYEEKQHSIDEICQMMQITKPTLYSYIRHEQKQK